MYFAFSTTGIHLFKINNKNRKTLCEICPELTRKAPVQMCGTNVCTFSVILTSLHSLNLSFPLPIGVISTVILKFPLWFPLWFPTFFAFPTSSPHSRPIPDNRILIVFLVFPPLFYAFPSFHSLIPHFYR